MARFSPEFLDELRTRISIVEVVGRRVTWDRRKSVPAKGDYWACCPFHGEKTPSFHVDERKGFYHCFGCHESGSALDFLIKHDGMSFPEAVEMLAGEAGMALPARRPEEAAREKKRANLSEVMEMAVRAFREALASPVGAEARAYLERRGLAQETIDRFEIGFAPAGEQFERDPMTRYLIGQGATLEQLIEVDIAGKRDGGGAAYDRFSNRVMFPIRDARGRCVAFGGRALSADARAKYLNSRETALFDKGRTLYNFGAARTAAAQRHGEASPIVVVEGYMDVIALAEAGVDGAVAPMGTALTENQLALLWRATDEPILMLDGDQAGRRAAFRAADLALPGLKPGKSLRFAWTPPGLDPDDLVRSEGGLERLGQILAEAEPLFDVIWKRETTRGPLDTPERQAGFEKALREIEAQIADEDVRRRYNQAFRDSSFHLFRAARSQKGSGGRPGTGQQGGQRGAWKQGRGAGRGFQPPLPGPAPETISSRMAAGGASGAAARREAAILVIALNYPALALKWEPDLTALEMSGERLDSVRNAIISALSEVELSDLDDSLPERDSLPSTEALESYVDERCGQGVCKELRAAVEPWLPRGAALGGETETAETVFLDAFAVVKNELTWRRECEEYTTQLLDAGVDIDQEDYEPRRLQSAQAAAQLSLLDAGAVDDDEEELSRRLQSFVDDQLWIKRGKGSSPPPPTLEERDPDDQDED